MPPQLEGRMFSRLQQFAALPEDLQNEAKALELHLTETQAEVFGPHHANLIKTVRSVRAKPLLEKITAWLKAKEAPPAEPESNQQDADAAAAPTATADAAAPAEEAPKPAEEAPKPAEEEAKPAEEAPKPAEEAPKPAEEASKPAEEEAKPAAADANSQADADRLAHAKKLLEALVLHGFITPNKERDPQPTATAPLVFKDSELFVPIAPAIADNAATPTSATTVWQLVDGASFAGFVKRKAGFLAPLTQGKDAYLLANSTLKTVTLFDSDVGRVPVAQFEAASASVAFDKSHFVHGVKLWNDTTVELLNAPSKLEREALVHALVALGLTYREEPTLDVDKVASIYALKDVDIDGNEVAFEAYKGKVLLVVNVSSQCGLTPTNYPELAALDAKYREQGLQVLAFPSNQFGGQEPGTHEEIKAFVQQYDVQFPLFAKGDVNGVDTRPVFSFLKAKLAGATDGAAYIPWNFTKFLVDRNGVPVKRFGPRELPLSFESEIVTLLFQQAEVQATETTATTTTTTTEATTTTETTTTETTTAADTTTTTEVTTETAAVEVATETTAAETETVAAAVATEEVATQSEAASGATVTTTTTTTTSADGKVIETVVTKVTTLSVDDHPVEETTTKTQTIEQQSPPQPGFTPGNEPAP